MKNENKCFFSVSLENGITITGDNPKEVLEFLYDAHSAFFELSQKYGREHFQRLEDYAIFMMNSIGNAIDTITNNLKDNQK